ncbi:hypothetical protein QBC45DRAFT_306973, partial [Copromyces sp. CBS 386.78]
WTGQKEGLFAVVSAVVAVGIAVVVSRRMDGMADCGPLAGRRVLSSFNLHSGRHM